MANLRRVLEVVVDPTKAKQGAQAALAQLKRLTALGQSELNKLRSYSAAAGTQLGSHIARGANSAMKAISAMVPVIGRVGSAFLNLSRISYRVMDGITRAISGSINAITRFTSGITNSFGKISQVALPIGIGGMFHEIIQSGLSMTKFASTMSVITGSAESAQKELAGLMVTADQMGIIFSNVAAPFAKFAAAAKGVIPVEDIRKIFTAFTEVSSALFMTNQEVQGVFLALQQMASKGTISMEELRLQLAERIPGAMSLAAKAMGVDIGTLEQNIRKGLVSADEFLAKFAEQIHLKFSKAAEIAASSAFGAFNRLKNQLFVAGVEIANAGLLDSLSEGAARLTQFLKDNPAQLREIGRALSGIVDDFVNWLTSWKPEDVKQFFLDVASNLRAVRDIIRDIIGLGRSFKETLGPLYSFTMNNPLANGLKSVANFLVDSYKTNTPKAIPNNPDHLNFGRSIPGLMTNAQYTSSIRSGLTIPVETQTPDEFLAEQMAIINSKKALLAQDNVESLQNQLLTAKLDAEAQFQALQVFAKSVETFDEARNATSKYAAALTRVKDLTAELGKEQEKLNKEFDKRTGEIGTAFLDELVSVNKSKIQSARDLESLRSSLTTPEERVIERMNQLGGARANNLVDQEEFNKLMERLKTELKEVGEKGKDSLKTLSDFAKEAAANMQTSFADFLFDPFDQGLKGMVKGFGEVLRRMAAELLAQHLLMSFFNGLAGSSNTFIANTGKAFGGSVSSGNASGGAAFARRSYLVGESGPEVITMGNGNGSVSPISGSSIEVNVINNSGVPVDADVSESRMGGKQTLDIVLNAVAKDITRRGVVGKAIDSRSRLASR